MGIYSAPARLALYKPESVASSGSDGDELDEAFQKHFTIMRADTDQLKARFYRLRHQVYCVENPFEDASNRLIGMELDEFDEHSVCSLLIHRTTGMVAGGIRLILPHQDAAARDLPLWRVCDRAVLARHSAQVPRARTGEVSRNAISKQFRRMLMDRHENSAALHRIMRNLSLGLLSAVVGMAAEQNLTHVCAAMEAPMLRMFSRLGIHFQKLGPTVEFHGIRQPAYGNLDALLAGVWVERLDVWALLTRNGRDWPLNMDLVQAMSAEPRVRQAV